MKRIFVDDKIKTISIEINKSGFTVWIFDKITNKKYWVIDGSNIKEDSKIRLGDSSNNYNIQAIYEKNSNVINLIYKNE